MIVYSRTSVAAAVKIALYAIRRKVFTQSVALAARNGLGSVWATTPLVGTNAWVSGRRCERVSFPGVPWAIRYEIHLLTLVATGFEVTGIHSDSGIPLFALWPL